MSEADTGNPTIRPQTLIFIMVIICMATGLLVQNIVFEDQLHQAQTTYHVCGESIGWCRYRSDIKPIEPNSAKEKRYNGS